MTGNHQARVLLVDSSGLSYVYIHTLLCLGVGCTVPVEDAVIHPFPVSVNVYIRITDVFYVSILSCDTIVLASSS